LLYGELVDLWQILTRSLFVETIYVHCPQGVLVKEIVKLLETEKTMYEELKKIFDS